MKALQDIIVLAASLILLNACYHPVPVQKAPEQKAPDQKEAGQERKSEKAAPDIITTQSIIVPKDRDVTPIAGEKLIANPDTVITVSQLGQKYEIKLGQEVNVIYGDGIDPDATFFVYESTNDGYILELRKRNDEITVAFNRLCQVFIVASPNLTDVEVPANLKYEQIIWTPRMDGSWEARIGTTERGCKSKALQDLKNMRTKEYENSLPK